MFRKGHGLASRARLLSSFVCILVIVAAAGPGLARDAGLKPDEREAGFRPLFNNRDLDGWIEVQGRPGTFSVRDGILVGERKRRDRVCRLPDDCRSELNGSTISDRLRQEFARHEIPLGPEASLITTRPGSRWQILGRVEAYSIRHEDDELNVYREGSAYWLGTQRTYGDFELRLEYRLPPGGNSGIFIRAPHHGRTSRMGMEIQLLDDQGRAPDVGRTGAIYRVVAPREVASRPAGEWNELTILCHGERIRITLNGMLVTDARMCEHKALQNRFRKGYIGLSAHSHMVEFRNIRLREIFSPPPPEWGPCTG